MFTPVMGYARVKFLNALVHQNMVNLMFWSMSATNVHKCLCLYVEINLSLFFFKSRVVRKKCLHNFLYVPSSLKKKNSMVYDLGGGAVAQSVERATPGDEALGSIPLWPPAPYWLGRCQYNVTG